MKSFMYAAKAIFVTLLLCCSGLAYADGECPNGPDGSSACPYPLDLIDVIREREREENEGHCRVDCGGGGERDTGGGGNGSSNSVTEDQKKAVVEKYKLPCIGANESAEAYSARAMGLCTADSYDRALDEYPILRYLPGGRVALLGTITSLCTTHVVDQISSNKYSKC